VSATVVSAVLFTHSWTSSFAWELAVSFFECHFWSAHCVEYVTAGFPITFQIIALFTHNQFWSLFKS